MKNKLLTRYTFTKLYPKTKQATNIKFKLSIKFII